MVQVDTGRFLNELGRLFEKAKAKDSVRVTLKRSNLKPRKSKKPNEEAQYVCLVRATDGNKKISTTVTAKDYSRFQESYATILKAHMDALKRKEKTKAKPTGKKA
ncbi:g4853 [Coccomyxa viridis]|uniref:Signal recognition particle 14 kDa protein n=1 Tax=Coccomyxa viridis TaxID=1274662 RepID=A0ABP1FRC7_9CHLO